jgi:hypothetical protein
VGPEAALDVLPAELVEPPSLVLVPSDGDASPDPPHARDEAKITDHDRARTSAIVQRVRERGE